jgi:hypothetical protein
VTVKAGYPATWLSLMVHGPGRRENGLVITARGFFPAGRGRGVTVAVGLGLLLAVTGVAVTRRSTGRLPAMSDPVVRRRYRVIVGAEFGLLVAVAAAALVVGLASRVAPSTITGPGAGLCLLAFGLATVLARGPGRVI